MDDIILDTPKPIQEPKTAYRFVITNFIWDDKANHVVAKGVWKDNSGMNLGIDGTFYINDPDFTAINNELIKTGNVDKKVSKIFFNKIEAKIKEYINLGVTGTPGGVGGSAKSMEVTSTPESSNILKKAWNFLNKKL